jgi:glycolate oxidase
MSNRLSEAFIAQCKALIGTDNVIVDAERLRVYECDALASLRTLPLMVVLPETVDQIQALMRLCYDHDVPIVARGAGTGLAGGAMPVANGILLGLSKMQNILEIAQ